MIACVFLYAAVMSGGSALQWENEWCCWYSYDLSFGANWRFRCSGPSRNAIGYGL